MGVEVRAVLHQNGQILGVRVNSNVGLIDVSVDKIKGFTKKMVEGVPALRLVKKDGLLVSEEEAHKNIIVVDGSNDELVCRAVRNALIEGLIYRENDKLQSVLSEWYHKGFATWETDGKDGAYGGSFHYMDNLIMAVLKDGTPYASVYVDFGGSNIQEAIADLNRLLKQVGCTMSNARYLGSKDSNSGSVGIFLD